MIDSCNICGGDGRIANSFGNTTSCPGCHGTGRRPEVVGLRDVTKTKPSHHRPANGAGTEKPKGPSTLEGMQLAAQVQASANLSSEVKAKLVREIMEHESSHAVCTQTFIKKIRKQVGPPAPGGK
jgi:RecJ-like exonuclease